MTYPYQLQICRGHDKSRSLRWWNAIINEHNDECCARVFITKQEARERGEDMLERYMRYEARLLGVPWNSSVWCAP